MERAEWQSNGSGELEFWKMWLDTKGAEWPADYVSRTNPDAPLQDYVAKHLSRFKDGDTVRILDVGAGPLTILGKKYRNLKLEITAVDALADQYATLQLPPQLVPTTFCDSEALSAKFPANSFDVVHASNTLDHGYNPVQAFSEMHKVAKPGGFIVTKHLACEAINENWQGFHQWNFIVDKQCLLLTSRTHMYNISDMLRGHAAVVEIPPDHEPNIICVWQKNL